MTDALYFLLIVTGISVFLFSFANGYGNAIGAQLSKQYNVDFATSALKTILYSSTPRDPMDSLYDSGVEIDYLLAYLKEDYSDDQLLEKSTMEVLAKDIQGIMAPVSDNFDYLFYIWRPADGKPVFVLLHFTDFELANPGARDLALAPKAHKEYFCSILMPTDGAGNNTVPLKVNKFMFSLGESSQASSRLLLMKQTSAAFPSELTAMANFVMWPGTKADLSPEMDWGCCEIGAGNCPGDLSDPNSLLSRMEKFAS